MDSHELPVQLAHARVGDERDGQLAESRPTPARRAAARLDRFVRRAELLAQEGDEGATGFRGDRHVEAHAVRMPAVPPAPAPPAPCGATSGCWSVALDG